MLDPYSIGSVCFFAALFLLLVGANAMRFVYVNGILGGRVHMAGQKEKNRFLPVAMPFDAGSQR